MTKVKVYTKYDIIPNSVIIPYIRKLTRSELRPLTAGKNISSDQTGFITEKELYITKIVYGLEDVKFVHYRD